MTSTRTYRAEQSQKLRRRYAVSDFNIIWEIDVDAASPEDAARMARAIQYDRDSMANVYLVGDDAGNRTTIDLNETERSTS